MDFGNILSVQHLCSEMEFKSQSYSRTGVSLYYFHWTHPQSESRELSLTTDMSMYAQLVMTREKYLGKPYR